MLDNVISLLAEAERSADRVTDLCRSGQPVDNELSRLTEAVSAVVSRLPNGVPPELHGRWHTLSERVGGATTAAEARRCELAAELEQTARNDRVRRAYVRPPS